MLRLLPRPARGGDAVKLEEANEPDGVGKAGDESARVADRAPCDDPVGAEICCAA